jgi:hypothetical protein
MGVLGESPKCRRSRPARVLTSIDSPRDLLPDPSRRTPGVSPPASDSGDPAVEPSGVVAGVPLALLRGVIGSESSQVGVSARDESGVLPLEAGVRGVVALGVPIIRPR